MRDAIARQMAASWQQIPHYRVATRIDVDRVISALEARNQRRAAAERVLPAAVLVHAAAQAVRAVPAVNGQWVDGAFRPGDGVHLGVVVALRAGGLLVPVLRDADSLDLDRTMDALRDLVTRARAGHLRASEVSDATFTVTDLGEGGADTVHPIIHPPQVAILGFGSIHPEVCAIDGQAVPRAVVHASLAGDHRAIDGRIGSLFLTTLTRILREDITP
jgi:pyruvate dehydrogenase E2 component (dihydrolipoamide acetyltransferase)